MLSKYAIDVSALKKALLESEAKTTPSLQIAAME